MLHTCQSCDEAWSGDYIRKHRDLFEIGDTTKAVLACPHCAVIDKPVTVYSPAQRVQQLSYEMGGEFWLSARGVPHFTMRVGRTTYSVCYFGRSQVWRIFWPYPAAQQDHVNLQTPEQVKEFFANASKKETTH